MCTQKVVFPAHTMKAYRRSRGVAPLILSLGTRGEWLKSRPDRFPPGNKTGAH
jgi:hypothetical protein